VNVPEDGRLITVAAAISNGDEVGWSELQDHNHDPVTSRMLRELQVVERIAAFHRGVHSSEASAGETTTSPAELTLQSWGHLTLLERIGTGAFGSVYRARDSKLQTDVALKLVPLRAESVGDPVRSLKEARLLARIRHPNVVRVHGADVIDGRVGIWMEFVEGQTLAAMLRARGSLGAREAALIGADLCQALAAVHAAGLIHGDVKAGNVMREAGGRTVLMDFGTGKDVSLPLPAGARGLDFAGTPLYLAPEVFRGEARSKLNDVYALGVLLFHIVTKDYPVVGRTQADVEDAHKRGARRRLRDIRPDLPAMFVEAVERALAADPRERFQSIGEFEAALTRFLGRTDQRWAPGFRTWLVAACVALVAGLGTVAYWTKYRVHVTPPAATAQPVTVAPRPAAPSTYQIDAAVYRRRAGSETRLRVGDRVGPGDELYATLRVSEPTYVYIVNEDDRGDSFLLFPLPGRAIDNPIAAATPVRIPGTRDKDLSWQVTSAGGREHFLIFASSERLQAFEELFAGLPQPTTGTPVVTSKLPESALKRLRGVGGLTTAPAGQGGAGLAGIFTLPLGSAEETAHGLWVRQLTVENPIRK